MDCLTGGKSGFTDATPSDTKETDTGRPADADSCYGLKALDNQGNPSGEYGPVAGRARVYSDSAPATSGENSELNRPGFSGTRSIDHRHHGETGGRWLTLLVPQRLPRRLHPGIVFSCRHGQDLDAVP